MKYINPDYETLDKMIKTVQTNAARLDQKEKKLTIFYFFSGIAINDGSHSLVINEVES